MDDSDLVRFPSLLHTIAADTWRQGVALAVTSLVMTVAQDHLDAFAVCYQKAVHRLSKVNQDLN